MGQRALEKADQELLKILHSMTAVVSESPRLQDMLAQKSSQDSTPWFEGYFTQYFDLLNFLPHESRDFPLVCKSCLGGGLLFGLPQRLFFSYLL